MAKKKKIESLHEIAGSIWRHEGDVCVLAQVAESTYLMIDLKSGNRIDGIALRSQDIKAFKAYIKDRDISNISDKVEWDELSAWEILYAKKIEV